jgi:hypothetical protein
MAPDVIENSAFPKGVGLEQASAVRRDELKRLRKF